MRQESARRIWLMLKKSLYTAWLSMEASAAWGSARQSFSVPAVPALVGCAANRQPQRGSRWSFCARGKGPEERRWLAVGRLAIRGGQG